MKAFKLILLTAMMCTLVAGTASAKKKGKHPRTSEGVKTAHLGIPPGHLPAPGECRVWYPGRPPGHQPPPQPCNRIRRKPAGAWLVYRPDHEHVRVSVISRSRPGIIVGVRLYQAETGLFIRFESR